MTEISSQSPSVRWLRYTSRCCGLCVAVIALAALLGWFTGRRELASVREGFIPMAPNTALGFLVLGASMWPLGGHRRRASTYAVGAIAAIALLRLIEYVTSREIGVDQWILHFPAEKLGLAPVGRMALFTAIGFVLVTIAMICLTLGHRHVILEAVSRVLGVVVGFGGLLFALGYAYGKPLFYSGAQIPMALNTAICFLLLGLGLTMLGVAGDVFDRIRAKRALAESEERHRIVVQQAADGITLVDAETLRIIEVNQAFARLVGYPRDELIGRPIADFIADSAEGIAQRAQQTLGSSAPTVVQRQYRRKDGSTVDVEKSATVLQLGGRKVMCTVIHDISERTRAEAALRQSEERTRRIVETANDAFISMDANGIITGWNAQAERTFGWTPDEAIGGVLAETIVPPQFRAAHTAGLKKFLSTGEGPVLNKRIEITAVSRDGQEFPVELTISPLRVGESYVFNAFVHDISERKRAHELLELSIESERTAHRKLKEAQTALVQTEKLASLGQMVAGVAHEINNPLAFVSNNVAVLERDIKAICELLMLYTAADPLLAEKQPEVAAQIRDLADRIDLAYTVGNLSELTSRSREGLRRIQQIVKDLRDFARLDRAAVQDIDINAGIESTINIITGVAKKKHVNIEKRFATIPRITCQPAKINQVVMNLLSNAIDASPENGTVIVRTEASDSVVRIDVQDNGNGIEAAIRERIFDPFFTTKAPGAGTGLGLSISYGIIKEHGGRIDVDLTVGRGTTFTITLPIRQAAKTTNTD